MSKFIEGQSRTQSTLFPEVLDDYINDDNPIRAIDIFIDSLDFAELGFARSKPARTGRPSYSPATMLKLYLYGYLNRIQSSRRLEKESQRNVELMWLVEKLTPDFKTIADFRKNNCDAIQKVCKQFVQICRELDMFSDCMIAIDGSKVKACNSLDQNYSEKLIKANIELIEKDIKNYLMLLERADRQEQKEDSVRLKDKLMRLRKRLAKQQAIQEDLDKTEDKQVSYTDPDSRLMKLNKKGMLVGYNVQAAVDTKHHLIIAHEVTNATSDRHQLLPMSKQVQEVLDKRDLTILADRGYYDTISFKAIHEEGITAIVPKTKTSNNRKKGLFVKDDFIYDAKKDVYKCPAGRELPFSYESNDRGKPLRGYLSVNTCKNCELISKCTTSSKGRRIRRLADEAHAEQVAVAYKSMPDAMRIRHQTVEHPFGTIKHWIGAQHLFTRRFKNVKTEVSLHVLAYNFKRMMTIFGVKGLMSVIAT